MFITQTLVEQFQTSLKFGKQKCNIIYLKVNKLHLLLLVNTLNNIGFEQKQHRLFYWVFHKNCIKVIRLLCHLCSNCSGHTMRRSRTEQKSGSWSHMEIDLTNNHAFLIQFSE
ncbi:hypothetical protein KSF78_0004109 [Schistosoma japonicum]|nr:hypothetical protein KSF78_0004109 [Schistosoma japonicum]